MVRCGVKPVAAGERPSQKTGQECAWHAETSSGYILRVWDAVFCNAGLEACHDVQSLGKYA
jgi:hypothetical protein